MQAQQVKPHIMLPALIAAGIGLVLLSVGYFWFVLPMFNQVRVERELSVLARRAQLQARLAYVDGVQTLVESAEKLSPDARAKLNTLLPDAVEGTTIANVINTIAERHGLRVRDLTVGTADTSHQTRASTFAADNTVSASNKNSGTLAALGVVNVDLTTSGADAAIISDFLKDIEGEVRLMDVERVTFEASGGTTVKLSLATYFLPNSTTVKANI